MKTVLRSFLKIILKVISKIAIKKHNIRVIAISGWYGTWIVKESLYHVLKDDYKVRRNVKNINWDFSIPLNVLGYEDKLYSMFEWIKIIISSMWVLLFEPANQHVLILELDADREEIFRYWTSILTPETLIIVNSHEHTKYVEDVLVKGLKNYGLIVCSEFESSRILTKSQSKKYKIIAVDNSQLLELKGKQIVYDGNQYYFETNHPLFVKELLIQSIPVAENYGLSPSTVLEKLRYFEVPEIQLKQIINRLALYE